MDKKSQVLLITLWILLMLTILAVNIGHRTSIALRLSKYQRERLRAFYLAKAGLNRAIVEIRNDDPSYDSLRDKWADNEAIFKKITLGDDESEFAQISYTFEEDEQTKTVFGVIDEERKINLNTASEEMLTSLLEACGIFEAEKICTNIRAWRGDKGITSAEAKDYKNLGYTCKEEQFSNPQELILVKDITHQIYNSLKPHITVYGSGKLNINTISEEILNILIESCVKKLKESGESEFAPGDLAKRIIQLRKDVPVTRLSDLQGLLENQGKLSSGQINILNRFQEEADTKSTCFYITSDGKTNAGKFTNSLQAIYARGGDNKIIYWHEN